MHKLEVQTMPVAPLSQDRQTGAGVANLSKARQIYDPGHYNQSICSGRTGIDQPVVQDWNTQIKRNQLHESVDRHLRISLAIGQEN